MRRLVRKLLPEPSREGTARDVQRALESVGIRSLRYDEAEFSLRSAEGGTYFLGNIHRELCLALPWQRGRILRRFASSMMESRTAELGDFEQVRPRLLPGIRHSFLLEALRLQACAEGSHFDTPFRTLGERLAIVLNADFEESVAVVGQTQIDEWGTSFDEAMGIAIGNLQARSAQPFEEILPGLYHSPWQDCFDASRLLLPGVLGPLDLEGDPVAVAPNWNHVFVTGAESLEGVVGLFVCAEKAQDQESKPMSRLPLVRREGEWVDLALAKGHEAEPLLRKHRVIELAEIYEQQKTLIDRLHERERTDIYVAAYNGTRDQETDQYDSYCVWSKGVVSLLPEAEQVTFFDDDQPDDSKVVAQVDWGIVAQQCAERLEDAGYVPRRHLVRSFPDASVLSQMRRLQQNRRETAS